MGEFTNESITQCCCDKVIRFNNSNTFTKPHCIPSAPLAATDVSGSLFSCTTYF
jgi:hypothetical protein